MPPTQPAAPGTAPSPKNYPTQNITHAETEKPDGRCLRSWALDTEEVSNRQGDSRSGDWSQQGSGGLEKSKLSGVGGVGEGQIVKAHFPWLRKIALYLVNWSYSGVLCIHSRDNFKFFVC